MKKKNIILGIVFLSLMIAVDIFIMIEAGTNGTSSGQESGNIANLIATIFNTLFPWQHIDSKDPTYLHIVRKMVGHFSLFGVSGLFTILSLIFLLKHLSLNKWWLYLFSSLKGFIWAALSEIVQLFTPDRSGAFIDVLIDFAGFIAFSIVAFLIYIFIIYINKRKEKTV